MINNLNKSARAPTIISWANNLQSIFYSLELLSVDPPQFEIVNETFAIALLITTPKLRNVQSQEEKIVVVQQTEMNRKA